MQPIPLKILQRTKLICASTRRRRRGCTPAKRCMSRSIFLVSDLADQCFPSYILTYLLNLLTVLTYFTILPDFTTLLSYITFEGPAPAPDLCDKNWASKHSVSPLLA